MALDRPGFADPATDSQACFRALLDAMSRPGTILPAGAGLHPPPPLDPATAAALLTLVDADAPLWLDPALQAAWDWVAFHCGALAGPLEAASFACAASLAALTSLHPGSDLAPETSATLILQVPALGSGPPYRLTGPGIRTEAKLRVSGLPADFPAHWAANGALYPCGVDLVLCAEDRLCALPRTTRVEEG